VLFLEVAKLKQLELGTLFMCEFDVHSPMDGEKIDVDVDAIGKGVQWELASMKCIYHSKD
jgi:hypothetical protein